MYGFCIVLVANNNYLLNISLNSVNQVIFVMVKCVVILEVLTVLLNIILTSEYFKGLRKL
jgi:hypothetical protein